MESAVVRIRLFDTASFGREDAQIALPYKQAEQALIYLVLESPLPVDREVVAELLWPGKPDGVARRNLRHALHSLRRNFGGGEFLVSTKNRVLLSAADGLDCDYFEFQKLVAAPSGGSAVPHGTVMRVLELYKRGLLVNYSAEPSPEFGFWLLNKREDCAARLNSFLTAAIPALCAERNIPLLTTLAERLMSWNAFDTSTYEYLVRTLVANGDGAFAARLQCTIRKLVEKSGEFEAVNALAEMAARVFSGRGRPSVRRLPAPTVPFVGRSCELKKLEALVRKPEARLITLCAPGGYGKTSLAEAFGRKVEDRLFPGGIYFVEWNNCATAADCVSETLRQIGLESGEAGAEDALAAFLNDRKSLVIFDELEEKSFGYGFIERVLGTAPELTVLATSRRRMGLSGEWVFALRPMASASEAAELFRRAAERKTGKNAWSGRESALIEKICRLLDGIPLAIELAAVRAADLDLDSLYRRVRKLASGSPNRELDLQGVIEYQLSSLNDGKRRRFYCLALFSGVFDRPTACGAFSISEGEFAEYCLLSLVWPAGGGLFRIHCHVRAHSLGRLKAEGAYEAALARLYAHLAEICEKHFLRLFSMKEDPIEIVARYPLEIQRAWLWALRRRRWEMAEKIVAPLVSFVHQHGYSRKGRELFTEKIELLLREDRPRPDPRLCRFLMNAGIDSAVIELQNRDPASARAIVQTLKSLDRRTGYGFLKTKKKETDPYRQWLALAYTWEQGIDAYLAGQPDKAKRLFLSCRELAIRYGSHFSRVFSAMWLARMEFETDPEAAIAILNDALETSHGRHIIGLRGDINLLLAQFHYRLGRRDAAKLRAQAALDSTRDRPASRIAMEALFLLAALHLDESTDTEIPKIFLRRALMAGRKSGCVAMAVEASVNCLKRWIEVHGKTPDWELYDGIAVLLSDRASKKWKVELDRLYGLA